ncbi:hypothetical protein [Alsobacter sp. R-9]
MPSRDDLIDAVAEGRLSPDEAEAEALRLGLEPLALKPDPADYDPMGEPYWTPIMALAWIMWRSPDAVREAWPAYAVRCRTWRLFRLADSSGADREVWSLEPHDRPTFLTLHLVEVAPRSVGREARPVLVTLSDAHAQLMDRLRLGTLTATGVPLPDGPRQYISQVEWIDLDIDTDSEDDRFHRMGAAGTGSYGFVLVPRNHVVRFWKPGPPPMIHDLPTVVRPDGPGFMTVFHALLWLATSGGRETVEIGDTSRWQMAFELLMPQIASGHIPLTGERDGVREVIPALTVAACRFVGPFVGVPSDLTNGSDLYLRSQPYAGDEQWRNGFDDALLVGQQERWTRLMVPKEKVAEIWPFDLAVPRRTGAPGRPTSMDLIRSEFDRRVAEGILEERVGKEAAALRDWLQRTHEGALVPTVKTIRNNIGHAFLAAKNGPK